MTSRLVSQRLKDVGFNALWTRYWVYNEPDKYGLEIGNDGWTNEELVDGFWRKDLTYIPNFSAQVLYAWLEKNHEHFSINSHKAGPSKFGIGIRKGDLDYHKYTFFEYGGSLSDLLAEAIIWKLTNESTK